MTATGGTGTTPHTIKNRGIMNQRKNDSSCSPTSLLGGGLVKLEPPDLCNRVYRTVHGILYIARVVAHKSRYNKLHSSLPWSKHAAYK